MNNIAGLLAAIVISGSTAMCQETATIDSQENIRAATIAIVNAVRSGRDTSQEWGYRQKIKRSRAVKQLALLEDKDLRDALLEQLSPEWEKDERLVAIVRKAEERPKWESETELKSSAISSMNANLHPMEIELKRHILEIGKDHPSVKPLEDIMEGMRVEFHALAMRYVSSEFKRTRRIKSDDLLNAFIERVIELEDEVKTLKNANSRRSLAAD